MKQKIYKTLLAIAIVATAQLSHAQSPYYLNQVIVLNQGPYGAAPGPTIGSYNPATKTYQDFDTIPNAAFANDVIIDSGYIYVAADSFLIKYDLNTKQRLAVANVQGIINIAVWGNELLVTRGYENALDSYFQAYSKDSLKLIYSLPSVSAATAGIAVLNDTAYIAINGFWGTVGKLGIIDLNKGAENREIDLGTSGLNPYDVEVDGNTIFTVNNLEYSDSMSITKYSPSAGTFTTTVLNQTSGCDGATYYANNIYFQLGNDTNTIKVVNSSVSIWDSLKIYKSLAGMSVDSSHAYMYIGNTDYTSYGKVFIYNLFGAPVDSFNVDVTPSNFAFDVRSTTGINQISSFANLEVYPNPVADDLHLALMDTKDAQANITLFDILGRQVYQQQIPTNSSEVVTMNSLSPGIYFLKATTNSGELTKKIVKD